MVTKKNSPTTATPSPRPAATRRVVQGDISPSLTVAGIEGFTVDAAVGGAQETKLSALRDVLHGMPEDESIALLKGLLKERRMEIGGPVPNPDDELIKDWRDGGYPYKRVGRES